MELQSIKTTDPEPVAIGMYSNNFALLILRFERGLFFSYFCFSVICNAGVLGPFGVELHCGIVLVTNLTQYPVQPHNTK